MILLHGLSTSSVTNKKAFTPLGKSPVTFTNSSAHVPSFQGHRRQGLLVHSVRDGTSPVVRQNRVAWFQRPVSRQLKFRVHADKDDDRLKRGYDAIVDPDSPDFDDIKLDDEFYRSIGMTKEEAERSQQFHPDDADPEGRALSLDDIATLDPSLPDYIKKGLSEGKLFGPPIILLAGFRIEELPIVRYIVDAAGGQEVKVVPVRKEMLHAYVEDIVEVPEPEWNKPRPEDFAMSGGWGSQRTIVFGGMKVEAQAAVIEFLEEGGLPPICTTAATHETKRMKLGELLADAVKYQRSRKHVQDDRSDASDRITEELPDINDHMQTVIKNRMNDLEKGLEQGAMDVREGEDGILRVQKKSNADKSSSRAETQEQEISEDDVRKRSSFDGEGSTRVSTPEVNLYDSSKVDNNSNTLEESEPIGVPNPGPSSEIVIDEKVENKEDRSWDSQNIDSDQSPSNPSVSTSQKVTESETGPEATPLLVPECQSDEGSEGISTKSVSPSSTSASQPVGKDNLPDKQSLHADSFSTASNHTAPNQDLDDMFLIDSLVANTLGMDPSQAEEPEKPFDMDDLLNLPLGPDSVKVPPSKKGQGGESEAGKETNIDVTEGTIDVADEVYGLNKGEESNLSEVSKENSSEAEEQVSHDVGQHSRTSHSSEVVDSRSGVVEPDEVITNDSDIKSDDHDGSAPEAFKRTVLPPSVTTDILEEWIHKNTTETCYNPETHKHLFNQANADTAEPHIIHDTIEEGSKSLIEGEEKVAKKSEDQLGKQNQQEILASLRTAVKQGIDPNVLKQMVDSIVEDESQSAQRTGKESNITYPSDIDSEDSPLQELSNSSSSSAYPDISEMYSASPIPVDLKDTEIIAQNLGMANDDLGSKFSQPAKDEEMKTSNEEKQPVNPTAKRDKTTSSSMSPDQTSGSVQTLTRSELEALADRQGIAIEELLENVRRMGITLRE